MDLDIRENEPLHRHTTLRVGGPARYFAVAGSEAELRAAAAWARERGLPVFVLGGGSNVLAADAGYPGLVLRVALRGWQTAASTPAQAEVVVEAGEEWDALVARAVAENLAGWENLSLIPGTLGGAVAGNIGAYGVEIKDTLRWVEALDLRDGRLQRLDRAACQFAYRHSFFKTPEGRPWVVVRAGFALARGGPLCLEYQDLRQWFASRTPGLAEVREAVIAIRRRKLPDWETVGTAGSFFKNLQLSPAEYTALAARHPGLPGHRGADGRVKVPLGYVLDKICGLRGWRQGPAGLHEQQALVVVNHGGTAADIAALARHVAARVREATGLEIEWEVEKLGAV